MAVGFAITVAALVYRTHDGSLAGSGGNSLYPWTTVSVLIRWVANEKKKKEKKGKLGEKMESNDQIEEMEEQ